MKKLLFVGLLLLSGCLNTTNHHPYRDGRSKETVWWRTPYYADTPRDENPWLKFVHPQVEDEWHNPWKHDDLRQYGVDVAPVGSAGIAPVDSQMPEKEEEPEGASSPRVY